MWLVFLIHPNNINLIHRGRAKVSVSVKCLVPVKMYGNNPRKLFVKIIRNKDVRINEFPLFSFPFLRIVFISWCNLFINKHCVCSIFMPMKMEQTQCSETSAYKI
jgi:hypothetical protein